MRYYVHDSSWFDSHPYNTNQIKAAVRRGGGTNVRTARAYGWSNQRKVVTFNATPSTLAGIEAAVGLALGIRFGVIIHKQDW